MFLEVETIVFTDELDVGCEREKTQRCLQGVWPGCLKEWSCLLQTCLRLCGQSRLWGKSGVQLGSVKLKTHIKRRDADAQRAFGVQRRGLGWGCISEIWEEAKEEKHSRILVESPWPRRWGFRRQAGAAPWQFGFHGSVRAMEEWALGAPQGPSSDFYILKAKAVSLILSLSSFYNIII